MIIIKEISYLLKYVGCLHEKKQRIALVPTMGCLHEGHIKLINEAKLQSDTVIVTIFVNPIQFDILNKNEFFSYPRTIEDDYEKLNKINVDCVFKPSSSIMYPNGIEKITHVYVPSVSNILDGVKRPGHFLGVSTIVSKFFNLIKPDIAFFGEKDYQQLMVIRKMVIDMNYQVKIASVPIVRDKDGLALSSRNRLLTIEQRKVAPFLNKILHNITKNFDIEIDNMQEDILNAKQELSNQGFTLYDIYIRDADTLLEVTKNSKKVVVLISATLGKIRLIDNKIIKLR